VTLILNEKPTYLLNLIIGARKHNLQGKERTYLITRPGVLKIQVGSRLMTRLQL